MLLQSGCTTASLDPEPGSSDLFLHGVASGDPDTHSVVIWTRVSNVDGSVAARWQIATDPAFTNIANDGQVETNATRDYTVKVVADKLQPGTQYFYRFVVDWQESPVGMTRTLPVGSVDRLVLAVASCSNYPFGYFNAYEAIALDPDVDCVVHLGDYLYEYDVDGYGASAGRRLNRQHQPPHETVTLDDYRLRHAQYKADQGSIAMHRRHPLIAIWDDHESTNNPWTGGAQNHQSDEGSWEQRRAVSLQAYFEWMPVRDPDPGKTRAEYWRHFKWGDLASLITLENRHTGRSRQVEYGNHIDDIHTAADASHFINNILGAPDRATLSPAMESFLASSLQESKESDRRWRIIGNQTVMARRTAPLIDTAAFEQLKETMSAAELETYAAQLKFGELELPYDLDSWNGYPAARERFYDLAKQAGAEDLVVLAGDSHSFWSNALFDANGASMGVELGTGAVTSPGFPFAGNEAAQRLFDLLQAERNPEVMWTSAIPNGYIRIDFRSESARADYVVVSDIESPQYETEIIRSFSINHDGNRLTYT